MARTSNRGGSNTRTGSARSGSRSASGGSRNNNPSGKNQYSGGWRDSVTDRPLATAAAVGGAVAAGLFLWSRRNQISDQISNLSDQISDWREGSGSESDWASEGSAEGESFVARPSSRRSSSKSQSDIAEEALTMKSTGKKTKRPDDPTIEDQTKAGAVAY